MENPGPWQEGTCLVCDRLSPYLICRTCAQDVAAGLRHLAGEPVTTRTPGPVLAAANDLGAAGATAGPDDFDHDFELPSTVDGLAQLRGSESWYTRR